MSIELTPERIDGHLKYYGNWLIVNCTNTGYATIGFAATVLIFVGRLAQGFSAGVELGGVSVYLSEIAEPHNRGFITSWQSASQQVAVILLLH